MKLSGLEARLSAAALDDWITGADERAVDVALPKFALADTVRLGDVVAAMGLPGPFHQSWRTSPASPRSRGRGFTCRT